MLLLASTSDLLRVITSAAITVDVHASWVDLSGTTVTPGRTNTLISTATTTTVVGSPAASTYRTVKALTIRNRGASPSTVTVIHSDGTLIPELVKVVLEAGEQLHYQDEAGWWITDSVFRKKVSVTDLNVKLVELTADVANSGNNAIADVTGLSFPVLANKMYWFRFNIIYAAAATTTGSRWSINGPASPTYLQFVSENSLAVLPAVPPTTTRNPWITTYDLPAAANATSAATAQNLAILDGIIQPSVAGTVIARFASEITSSAITAKIGSHVRYQQVTA